MSLDRRQEPGRELSGDGGGPSDLVDSPPRIAPVDYRFHLAVGSRFENIELV